MFDDLLKNLDFVRNYFKKGFKRTIVVIGQEGKNEDFTGKNGNVIQKAIDYLTELMEK